MTAIVRALDGLSEAEWQALLDQQGRPCACTDRQGRPCLAHYALMDSRARARVRRTVGIRDFESRRG
jgi:hypothetical protein